MKLPSESAGRLTRFAATAAAHLGQVERIGAELEPLMVELGFIEADLRAEGYSIRRERDGGWAITGKPRGRFVHQVVEPPAHLVARCERLAGRITVLKREQALAFDAHDRAYRLAGSLGSQASKLGYGV